MSGKKEKLEQIKIKESDKKRLDAIKKKEKLCDYHSVVKYLVDRYYENK